MKASVYNIIWADDDIDSLRKDSDNIEILKEEDVNLLAYAHTSNELKEKLEEYGDMVDAVITDGNYDMSRESGFKETTTSGLTDTIAILRDFYRKRFVPAYLYTGKGKILKDKFSDGELDFFEKKERYFEKGKFGQMIKKIKEDVDHINSPEFRIRNKYAKEFEAAKLIGDATENLKRGLLYIYKEDDWKNTQDFFNPARKIVERIIHSCSDMNILPPHISLNIASKLLSGIDCGYCLKKELMQKPLAESLHFFLKITQDGSHDAEDLSLNVDQYVRNTQNINLYRTILYIAMDLLLWHMRMKELYSNNQERLWDSNFKHIGIVCKHPQINILYTDKYQLESKDVDIKEGDRVGILESKENNFKTDGITDFVHKNKYIILEKVERN